MTYGTVRSSFRYLAVLLASALAVAACSQSTDADSGLSADIETAAAADAERSTEAGGSADDAGKGLADDAHAGNETLALTVSGDPSSTTSIAADDGSVSTSSTAVTSEGATTSEAISGATTTQPAAGAEQATSTTSSQASAGSSTTAQGATTTTTTTTDETTTSGPTTTQRATTTTARATTQPPATNGSGGGRFQTLPPGASLPSGSECASRVRSAPETRSGNASYNATRGSGSNDLFPRVDGNYVGTTDEIIQWAACKWGIDEDVARAQAVKESWWDMTTGGDTTSNQSSCHPDLRTSSGPCAESIGLLQVRYLYHLEAFESSNSIRSTAYNIDYAYAVWRDCYEGRVTWLNDVERGREYTAGDLDGCLGVWFSGRWYVPDALPYIAEVKRIQRDRVWEQSDFLNY